MAPSVENDPSPSSDSTEIKVLPQHVVDQIAAGEVVQRPMSVVKELLENSVDAGATSVVISIHRGGLDKIVVSDDGKGIKKEDLELAAVRHATSKLSSAEDLTRLDSFGFRGEALASISAVAQLTITSRHRSTAVGYTAVYSMGKLTSCTPIARKVGTTVSVSNLFFNVKHRQKQRPSEEYRKILAVIQNYSVLYASRSVSIACEKVVKSKSTTDWNSSTAVHALRKSPPNDPERASLEKKATKDALSQILGNNISNDLDEFSTSLSRRSDIETEDENAEFSLTGFVSRTSILGSKRTTLIMFINNRLVENPSISKAVEDAFREFTKVKPVALLMVTVPANHIDVNVHPSKTMVTLLHQDVIIQHISSALTAHWSAQGQSFTRSLSETDKTVENPSKRPKRQSLIAATDPTSIQKPTSGLEVSVAKTSSFMPSSQKIRTSRSSQVGSIEPFLSQTQTRVSETQSEQNSNENERGLPSNMSGERITEDDSSSIQTLVHTSDCPLATASSKDANLDTPGAFASISRKCQCRNAIRIPSNPIMRPKKVLPSVCHYQSIQSLRKRIKRQCDDDFMKQLRRSVFCGVVSRQKCLLQAKDELLLVNHHSLAVDLFYQLGLAQFGELQTAKLPETIDIAVCIAYCLELEENVRMKDHDTDKKDVTAIKSTPSETNQTLADQAAICLAEKSGLLREYFGLDIGRGDENIESKRPQVLLTGLPVLMEGHSPPAHGLPIFLLRLATEVDWTEERPCFHGVLSELADFYAQVPTENYSTYIRHVLYPAISSLVVPSVSIHDDEDDNKSRTLTKLSKLYRVFERC